MIHELSQQLSIQPLQFSHPASPAELERVISLRAGPITASIICQALNLFQPTRISALRVSVVYPFSADDRCWILLEWRKSGQGEAMGIFLVDEEVGLGGSSWLILHSSQRETTERGPEDSSISRILDWNVTSMSALRNLFYGAQHASGLLDMPPKSAAKLYCHDPVAITSAEK